MGQCRLPTPAWLLAVLFSALVVYLRAAWRGTGPTNESTVTTRVEYHMTGPGATSLLPTGDLIVAATTHPHPATRDLFGHHSWALPPKVWALGGVAF